MCENCKNPLVLLVEHMEDVNADMIADEVENSEAQIKLIENQCTCRSIKLKHENGIQLNKEEKDYLEHIIDMFIWSEV